MQWVPGRGSPMPADVFELHKRRRAAELWRVRLVVIPGSLATCTWRRSAVPDVSQFLALAVAFALLAVEGPVWLRAVPDGRLRAIATWDLPYVRQLCAAA